MKKLILLLFFGILLDQCIAQENSLLSVVTKRLESFYIENQNEKVFIQTDKTAYIPGETVWFSAWTIDQSTMLPVEVDSDLTIRMYDCEGKMLLSDVYKLTNGRVAGDIMLNNDLAKGNYFITGILASHQIVEQLNLCKISVNPSYSNSLVFKITPETPILKKGVDNRIFVNVNSILFPLNEREKLVNESAKFKNDLVGEAKKKFKLKYSIKQGENLIQQGNTKTDDKGKAEVIFRIPEKNSGDSYRLIVSDVKGTIESFINLETENDRINLKFYPEGGTLIPSVVTKIGFYATNSLGMPINLEGQVVDAENNQVVRVSSIWKGFGIFPLIAKPDVKYLFRITSSQGQGQVFEIPPVNPKGVSLSITKVDNKFLNTTIVFADKQKHDIGLMVSSGGKMEWAGQIQINGSGNLKIPTEELQQGLSIVTCFSDSGIVIGQRLVNINKGVGLKIGLSTQNKLIKLGDEFEIKVQLNDNNGKPIGGKIAFSVSDTQCNDTTISVVPFELGINSFLKNQISREDRNYNEKIFDQRVLDYLLIANELKTHKIEDWMPTGSSTKNESSIKESNCYVECQLIDKVKLLALTYNSPEFNQLSYLYFYNNIDLIMKRAGYENSASVESYRKFLDASPNLLDVIRNIKTFTLLGNKIIFGGPTSINAQGGALIVIDGNKLGEDASVLNSISPKDVQDIKILTSYTDIQKYTGFNPVGVIEITLKKGELFPTASSNKQVQLIYNGKYRVPKIFLKDNLPDATLTTLNWNATIDVDNSGIYTIKVPASKVVSDFIIHVVGYGENGQFGAAKELIEVYKN